MILSLFSLSHNGDKEERCYVTGRLDGTAKYFYTSGAVETRIYENGVLQGKAVKQSSSGEVEERNYVDGKLNGKATVLYQDTSKEMRTYKVRTEEGLSDSLSFSFHQDNKLTGPASLFSASGERIEFEYCDGVVHGPAKIKVSHQMVGLLVVTRRHLSI